MSHCTGIVPIAATLVAGVVFGFSALRAAEQAPLVPDAISLAGRWSLNAQKSDDARKAMRETGEGRGGDGRAGRGGPPSPGPGGRRGGGMGRAGGQGPGRRPGGSGGGNPREAMRAFVEAPAEMLITPTQNEIVILETDGRLRALHPDGRTYKSEAGASETKTRWDGGRLVVETRAGSGLEVVETFVLLSAPARETSGTEAKGSNGARSAAPRSDRTLTVTVRIKGMRRPEMTLTRIYDLVASAE